MGNLIKKSKKDQALNRSCNQKIIESTTLDNLTYDLCQILFEYLSFQDLLNLRLVSTKVRENVKRFRILESCLNYTGKKEIKLFWYSINKLIDHRFIFNEPIILNGAYFDVQCLMRLKVVIDEKNAAILDRIKELQKLDQLEIELRLKKLPKSTLFVLPSLKVLAIKSNQILELNFIEIKDCLVFFCPELRAVKIDCDLLDSIKFSEPKVIKHLESDKFDAKLFQFKRLESIGIHSFAFTKDILLPFYDLNAIFINYQSVRITNSLDKLINLTKLKELLDFKCIARNQDLKIYYNSVLIDRNVLNNFSIENELAFYMRNYQLLSNDLIDFNHINYSKLMSLIENDLPADFFKKFINIQCIEINGQVANQKKLIKFIRQCANLCELKLNNSSLVQSFYKQLPLISSLIKLVIQEKKIGLNYEFFSKTRYLKLFAITNDRNSPFINLVNNQLLSTESLEEFHSFKINQIRLSIRELEKLYNIFSSDGFYLWKMSYNYNELISFICIEIDDYEELIKFFFYLKQQLSLRKNQIIKTSNGFIVNLQQLCKSFRNLNAHATV